jgi:hypothetical protein
MFSDFSISPFSQDGSTPLALAVMFDRDDVMNILKEAEAQGKIVNRNFLLDSSPHSLVAC